jgi:hypothetical protein
MLTTCALGRQIDRPSGSESTRFEFSRELRDDVPSLRLDGPLDRPRESILDLRQLEALQSPQIHVSPA